MHRSERERNPLDARQRHLADAEKLWRGTLKDDSGDDRSADAQTDATGQKVRGQTAQRRRQHGDDICREQQVPGEPDDRRREERDADDVLAVREREVLRVIDVRVEDRPGSVQKGVRVPPEQVPPEVAVGTGREPEGDRMQRQRVRKQHRERCKQQSGEPCCASRPPQRSRAFEDAGDHRAKILASPRARSAGRRSEYTRASPSACSSASHSALRSRRAATALQSCSEYSSPCTTT